MTQAATLAQLASSGALSADTSGNVGIGTSSPGYLLDVSKNQNASTVARIQNANTGASAFSILQLQTGATNYTNLQVNSAGNYFQMASSGVTTSYTDFDTQIWRNNAGTERMRIDTSGNLLVGTADAGLTSGVGLKLNGSSTTIPTFGLVVNYNVGTSSHIHLYNTNATNNGYRFYVVSNGGIYNYSGNNSNLSDERTKTNIELSGSYLSKICSIPVKLFNYKDEPENEQKTLGVVAQDVEKIAPELVNNVGFGDVVEGEDALKSIYTTDMMFALMKCIQELKAELDVCKAEIAALKGV